MPIPLSCPCGRAFNIKDECAGHKIRCPQCKFILDVPAPKMEEEPEEFDLELIEDDEPEVTELEVVEDEVEEVLEVLPAEPQTRRSAVQATPSAKRPPRLSSSQDEDRVRTSMRRDEEEPRPKRRRPRLRREDANESVVTFERGWFGNINAGVVGGTLMLLIGGAWLIGGLYVGILFFKPVFLIIIGMAAIIKGLLS